MLPNFVIVGAAKSGTTSMTQYLSQHPQIYMAERKESHYFSKDSFRDHFNGPGDEKIFRSLIMDEHKYEQLFDRAENQLAVGESSVFYLYYSKTAESIASKIPEAKIIIMLRDPTYRAFSAYMHLVRDGRETYSFGQALKEEQNRRERNFEPIWFYKEVGSYYKQVKHYMDVFGPENVKVVLFEEFKSNTESVLEDVFTFLNVNNKIDVNTSRQYNKSGIPSSKLLYNVITNPNLKKVFKTIIPNKKYQQKLGLMARDLIPLRKLQIEPEVEKSLKSFFAEDISKLEGLLKKDLSKWNN
jgi:hypothetical protein